ncbi:Cell division protein FtsA [hydrothermal vent metagenome]|uniref:Cell division protein FtsA n=1 Tax=hydrothermal vent metagenome TaxID=652676 RepID=A0A1W1BU12_9ZZZZ
MSKKNKQNEIVVSLDIGSSKVLVIVAENTEEGLRVLGYGMEPSLGVKQGVVVHMDETIKAISKAVETASLVSDVRIDVVSVGISGTHISSLNSKGRVSISHNEVDKDDIRRVLTNAEAITIPANQEILHVLPQSFIIDSKTNLDEPLGMHGDVLEAKAHVVTGDSSAIKNIVKSVEQCGLKASDIILEPLAAAESCLTKDEKDLGVCLLDIGSGITNISVFVNGSIVHTNVLPIAGGLVTDDLVYAFTTSYKNAEVLKKQHGCALAELIKDEELIEVEHISDGQMRKLTKRTLAEVIEARYDEIFTAVKDDLKLNGYESLISAGIVLTGGAANIDGCSYLAESIFNKPVRLAQNKSVTGLDNMIVNPSFSVGIGLLLFEGKQEKHSLFLFKQNNWIDKVKKWLSHF